MVKIKRTLQTQGTFNKGKKGLEMQIINENEKGAMIGVIIREKEDGVGLAGLEEISPILEITNL